MYCRKCGRPMDPSYKGLCIQCEVEEKIKNTSFAEYKANQERAMKKQKKDEKYTTILVIVLGLFCPIIWIIYFISQYLSSIEERSSLQSKSGYNTDSDVASGEIPSAPVNDNNQGSSPTFTEDTVTKEVTIIGGDGNIYTSSSPIFCDWEGNVISKGSPFKDSRGHWCQWGSSFYDNRDQLIEWGNPFYDAGDRLVDPRG